MSVKTDPELLLAKSLAAPFTPRCQGNPLSFRRVPEGGMVVIAADGRKLWFTAEEVAAAESELAAKVLLANKAAVAAHGRVPLRLVPPPPPPLRLNNGQPLLAVIHENQVKKNDHTS